MFRKNSGIIINPLIPASPADPERYGREFKEFGSVIRRRPSFNPEVLPGETPLFVLHSTNQFARYNQSVTYSLVALQNIRQKVCVYGQVLKPGREMYYDGTYPEGYFYLDSGDGGCVSGVGAGRFIKVYTRTVNNDDLRGTSIINFIITDENGQLLQQIISDLYIVQSGPFAPMYYVKNIKTNGSSYVLTGKFPVGLPIYYMIGVPEMGYSFSGSGPDHGVISLNGQKLSLYGSPMFSSSASIDFMGWDPVTRQAIIAPGVMTFVP